jgi:hypothetical protein
MIIFKISTWNKETYLKKCFRNLCFDEFEGFLKLEFEKDDDYSNTSDTEVDELIKLEFVSVYNGKY